MTQLLWHKSPPAALDNTVAVVSAGTSDMPIAEEAALTAEFYGNTVQHCRRWRRRTAPFARATGGSAQRPGAHRRRRHGGRTAQRGRWLGR